MLFLPLLRCLGWLLLILLFLAEHQFHHRVLHLMLRQGQKPSPYCTFHSYNFTCICTIVLLTWVLLKAKVLLKADVHVFTSYYVSCTLQGICHIIDIHYILVGWMMTWMSSVLSPSLGNPMSFYHIQPSFLQGCVLLFVSTYCHHTHISFNPCNSLKELSP